MIISWKHRGPARVGRLKESHTPSMGQRVRAICGVGSASHGTRRLREVSHRQYRDLGVASQEKSQAQ